MGSHSERWSPAMKTLLVLLITFAIALPMPMPIPEGADSSEESSEESNETSEDLEALESNPDFVIASACVVEAMDGDGNLDEESLDKCGQCFDEAEKQEGVEAAVACTVEHLPNFYKECKDLIDSPKDNEAEVLECFMDSVEDFDQTGEIRQEVKKELGL